MTMMSSIEVPFGIPPNPPQDEGLKNPCGIPSLPRSPRTASSQRVSAACTCWAMAGDTVATSTRVMLNRPGSSDTTWMESAFWSL